MYGGVSIAEGCSSRSKAHDESGRQIEKTWCLIAEGDSGPYIPAMAAECVIRKVLAGAKVAAGARSAIRDVDLADYQRLFLKHQIVSAVRLKPKREASLFERLLGNVWHELPEQLRALHQTDKHAGASGLATVVRGGRQPLARLIAWCFRLPTTATDVPITVSFDPTPESERWTRRFGPREMHSEMSLGRGAEEGLLIERFGPFSIALAVIWEAPRLKFVVRGWRIGPILLPRWLAPISETHESVEQGRFHFDVSIAHPLVGLLVRYRGWLVPERSCTGVEDVDTGAVLLS